MVISVVFYPVLHGLELFLASALITQIAVSLAAVVVSTVTIYFCRQQLIVWHQERVVRRRGRWLSDISIKSSKKKRGEDHSESSEAELSDPSLLRRLRAGLRSRSHDHLKTKATRESAEERILKSSRRATSDETKKEAPDSGRVRPKLTKQVGAMHRSHWVAKPQQSLPTGIVRRRSSESDAELRGGGTITGLELLVQEEPSISVSTDVMVVSQTGGKTLKRSRATARMTLKKHPRFSSSSSSSSASPASSSAESDDLVHGESADRVDANTDNTIQTRRVPSIQVEPIVEERIVPLGRHFPSHPSADKLSESTGTEISTLEFSFAVVETHFHLLPPESANVNVSLGITEDTAATDDKQSNKEGKDISNVPSIATSDTDILGEEHAFSAQQTESRQIRQDSLSVPPVIAGGEAYPDVTGAPGEEHPPVFVWVSEIAVDSSQRPLVLEPEIDLEGVKQTSEGDRIKIHPLLPEDDSDVPSPQTVPSSPLRGEVRIDQVKTMASLDVPSTITGEVRVPSLVLPTVAVDQIGSGIGAHTRKIVKMRPKSLDIPPMLPAPYTRSAVSAPSSPPSSAGHGVKRKHSSTKSILKRSGSVERPGRKKSVSFSPEVSPREYERCYHEDIDRDSSDSPKRPRVFRHFSMDIPDARIASVEDTSLSSPQLAWSHGDSDDSDHPDVFSPAAVETGKLSRAEGWVHPSPLEPMQIEGSDARMTFVPICTLEVDESGRKSAKERFLEAGGAKAVLSVLCTQDSSDSNGSKYTSSSATEVSTESPVNDGSEEDSMETMPDIEQQLSVSAEIDDDHSNDESVSLGEEVTCQETDKTVKDQADAKGIKTRFLEYKEDSADIHTSRLFVQTVRSSVESDSSDEQDRQPALQHDERSDDKDVKGGCEEDDDQTTSAKSRFLQSCQKVDDNGESHSGSRFVVSVVRPYTTGCHKQDSPSNGESTGPDSKPKWNREVPDGNSANTWQILLGQGMSDDIEFYGTSEAKSAEDANISSILGDLPIQHGGLSPASGSSSESEPDDGKASGISSRHQSDTYSTCLQLSPSYIENSAVVIDNGSEVIKVGFAGDLQPRFTLPSVVGRCPDDAASDSDRRAAYIGYEATSRASLLSLDYPSSEGVVHNWEDMEKVWDHVFTSLLSVVPQEHPVLISEYASTTKKLRGKYAEILFEKLQVPSLCLVNQGALALHSQGETSGIVLSSGGGLTEVVPVLDGCTVQHAVTTLKVAGKHVTSYLGNLLQSGKSYKMTSSAKMELLREVKETMAYVCMDFDREIQRVKHMDPLEYKLPDGSSLAVGHRELIYCTEQLFQPSLGGYEQQAGIHDMVQETLKRCDPTVLASIRKSILLAGGNTQLKGFGDRLQLELASAHLPWSVSMPQERTNSVWIGGSVVAAHGDFSQRCVTAEEYAEHGVAAVHGKCF